MEIRHHPRDLDFSDKRVTVVGLGIEGVDVARYLSRQGAMVTVSDSKPRQKLSERLQQVDNLGLKLALGSNRPDDIAEAEAVFISQGVPLDLPGMARPAGLSIELLRRLQPGLELAIFRRDFRLLAQARDLVAELEADVLDARKVLARVGKPALGLLAPVVAR